MKSNIEMKMDLMERRQAVHANKIQALMLMITVMQIPEKEKNRKILKAVRVSTALLWLLTCVEDVVLMIRKNYNWLAEKYSWLICCYMIVIKILDEKDWERKWIKKIGIVTGWVCLKMAWHWRKTIISSIRRSKGLYVPRIQEVGIYFILVEENEEVNIYKLCWRSYDFYEFELRRFIVRSRV